MTLELVKKTYTKELKDYEHTFEQILSSNYNLIDTIVKYIVRHKGKGLRPLLVIMSANLVGKANNNTFITASIVEMLHSASLIHDDVLDDAIVRRGFPTINAIWRNKISILMGDYLLSKCLIGATMTGSIETVQILANASKRLSKGELMQIEKSRKLNLNEEEYYQIISDKTAALISASTELGVLTASENLSDRNNLKEFGENLGIAFQIKDDLLDYQGHQKITGKSVGHDLKDHKITLPLIHAFKQTSNREIKQIKNKLRDGVTSKDVRYIFDFVKHNDGLKYAEGKLYEFLNKAKEKIRTYPESKDKTAFYALVDFMAQREK
jgi:octaprenyl-diphosphate synthase